MENKNLIGRKVRGFKFEDNKYNELDYNRMMDNHIGEVGEIVYYSDSFTCYDVQFEKSRWSYPAELIEQHLVDESPKLEEKTFTCQDLTDGKVACINDGTIEELNKVLGYSFIDDETKASGESCFYFKSSIVGWASRNSTDLPTQSVKVFLKEIEEKEKPTNKKVVCTNTNCQGECITCEHMELVNKEKQTITITTSKKYETNPNDIVVKNEPELIKSNPLDNLPIIGEGVDAMVSNNGMVENRAKVYCKIKDVYVAVLEGKYNISTWFLAEPITPKTKITRAEFESKFEIID